MPQATVWRKRALGELLRQDEEGGEPAAPAPRRRAEGRAALAVFKEPLDFSVATSPAAGRTLVQQLEENAQARPAASTRLGPCGARS